MIMHHKENKLKLPNNQLSITIFNVIAVWFKGK